MKFHPKAAIESSARCVDDGHEMALAVASGAPAAV